MSEYQISTVTGHLRPGITYHGALGPDEFARHLAASPWQPAATQPPRRPVSGWSLEFSAHVDGQPVRGRLGTEYNRLVLDGSIDAVSRLAVWYRALIDPDDQLILDELAEHGIRWLELTPQTSAAEIAQRLRARPSAPPPLSSQRLRAVRRRQGLLAAELGRAEIPATSLAVLHDTGAEVVFGLTVPWAEALARWHQARAVVGQTGHWPVLLDEEATARQIIEDLATGQDRPVAAILRASERITPNDIFGRWRPDDDAELGRRPDAAALWPDEGGSAPPRRPYFGGPDPLAGGRAAPPPVVLALAPARVGWEAPAVLRWGGPHGCPDPEEHVVVLRDWHERYGADLVAVWAFALELHAQRAPTTRGEALALAREHLAYCPFPEDAWGVEDLAKLLMVSRVWRFRWE